MPDKYHGDISLHGVNMKDVIASVLRKHEDTSLLTEDGINEVANDMVAEFALRLHLKDANAECKHESDGWMYMSNPPQNKCKKCGQFYR